MQTLDRADINIEILQNISPGIFKARAPMWWLYAVRLTPDDRYRAPLVAGRLTPGPRKLEF